VEEAWQGTLGILQWAGVDINAGHASGSSASSSEPSRPKDTDAKKGGLAKLLTDRFGRHAGMWVEMLEAKGNFAALQTMQSQKELLEFFEQVFASPLFTRGREDPAFLASITGPDGKVPLRYAMEDRVLSDMMRRQPGPFAGIFAEEAPAPAPAESEPLEVSVVRLGEDPPVKWTVTLQKTSLVEDLRKRLAEVYKLDEKAAKRLGFARSVKQSFISMTGTEKIRQAMAVRGLPGHVDWPPPT